MEINKILPILSIDIESGGCQPSKHPLVAIGICFWNNGLKEKKLFRFEFDYSKFEPRCVEEFWSKNMDKLEKFRSLPISNIKEFADYVDKLDEKYPNLTILSDNPAYDIGFINYLYDTQLNRKPLQYKYDGKYRIIVDQNSYLWAMCPELADPWIWDSKVTEKYNLSLTSVHEDSKESGIASNSFICQIMMQNIF